MTVPMLPGRRVCMPLLDTLHPPHDRRPQNEGSDGDDEGSSGGQHQPKTVAKASSLPLELTSSRTDSRTRSASVSGERQQSWAEAVGPYIEILRPQNIVPAMLLVLMGAWVRQ